MKRNCHIKGLVKLQFSDGTDFTLPGSTEDRYTYAYSYDSFGRLTESARYAGFSVNPNNIFTEKNLTYDRNGNILTLTRYGNGNATIKDNFIYSYDGNRLKHLAGTADYQYDGNGNMTLDALRNITLTYDINNLVSTVSRNDTLLSTYHYLADGTKYKVIDPDNNGRVYIGPFSYTTAKTGNTVYSYLEGIDTDGGRIMIVRKQSGTQNTYDYTTAFFVRDHLGSTRVMLNAQGDILERNAYYPFGLQMNQGKAYPTLTQRLPQLYTGYVSSTPARRDLYNGKEIQTAAGTDYIDYGFRQDDPVTARWMAVDPKAEKYLPLTPYNYCAGNSISLVDIVGALIDDYYFDEKTGHYLGRAKSVTNEFRTISKDVFMRIYMSNEGQVGYIYNEQLRQQSKEMYYSKNEINTSILDITRKSNESGLENNIFIVMDTNNMISVIIGPVGENSSSKLDLYKSKDKAVTPSESQTDQIIIAVLHGHPEFDDEGKKTVSGMSNKDKNSAVRIQIPVFATDAMDKNKLTHPLIHIATPDAKIHNRIGYVDNNFDLMLNLVKYQDK